MLTTPVRKMLPCFNLQKEKGQFLHEFNHAENYDDVGLYPSCDYYGQHK